MLHSTSPLCPSITGLRVYHSILVGQKVNSDAISGGFYQRHIPRRTEIPPFIAAKPLYGVANKSLLWYILQRGLEFAVGLFIEITGGMAKKRFGEQKTLSGA